MRILLTDGNERTALAAARSLVAVGHDVLVVAHERLSLTGVSRKVRPCVVQADPLIDQRHYAEALGQLVREQAIDVLLPVTDPSVEAVLEHRTALPDDLILPLPSLRAYREGSDKARSLELARCAGLGVPDTVVLTSPVREGDLPDDEFFPAIVKPHRSVIPTASPSVSRRKVGVSYVGNADACGAALATLPVEAFPVLLQRVVRGPGEGLFLLRWNGRMVATFAHRRLREKPPAGGVSVYRESISPDPELVAAGTRLLELLDWQGVAMIECKREWETGRHVFMEVNGRLWGSLQLAIDAGVDFPALLVACALGRPVTSRNSYRVGVRSRWLWGDVDHLYLRLRDSRGIAERLAAVRAFLGFRAGRDREETWRWRDPAPFLLESLRRLGLAR